MPQLWQGKVLRMTKTAALYLRVSTSDQTTENQRLELEAVAKQRGWAITTVYEDAGFSGAKGRDKRPQLDAMLKDAVRGRFDVIMVWSVDRLGRSLQDLVKTLDEVHGVGVDLYLHQQAIDTATVSGKAMFQMCGVFAEFERAMIQERVKAGLARAKVKGVRLGKVPMPAAKRQQIIDTKASGLSFRKTAEACGVALSTVQRVLHEAATA